MIRSNEIYIFGSKGLGKDTAYLIRYFSDFKLKAFIEADNYFDNNANTEIEIGDELFPIISENEVISNAAMYRGKCAAIGIANGVISHKIYMSFSNIFQFPNIIHPNSRIYGAEFKGIGNIAFVDTFFSVNTIIGSFNKFLPFVTVGHDCTIGNYNEFNPKASISGNVYIENNNLIGSNSVILQGLTIGSNNVIGMGAVVFNSIKDRCTYIGNPAKLFRKNE